jgi:hypothetical protein
MKANRREYSRKGGSRDGQRLYKIAGDENAIRIPRNVLMRPRDG